MGFASPWFLAAALGIALPVWLHLLRRSRSTPRPFSSVMLFEPQLQTSSRRRRLHYLLLFSLRALLILLLALAFSRPWVQGPPELVGGRRKVAAVDVSASMREGGRFESARTEAAAELRGAREARVITLGRTAGVHPANAVSTLQPTAETSSLAELGRAVRTISERDPLDVHLYSDFQKTALPAAFNELALPPNARLFLHPVTDAAVGNWAVESASAPPRVYDAARARVQATVRGFGTEAATRRVSVLLNGKELAAKDLNVPADGRATLEFPLPALPYGLNRGEIRIAPQDTLAADDHYYFSIERAEPRPALFLGGSRAALYLRAALEAAPDAPFRLEQSAAVQTQAPFVILADATPPDWLAGWVRAGGAALVALNAGGRVPLVDKALTHTRYYTRDGGGYQTATWFDGSHPAIKDATAWHGVRFYQVVSAEGEALRPLVRLSDGTPILSEARVGDGRVLVFGSTFDNVANDFPLHNAFVPFIAGAAAYLGGLEGLSTQHVAGSTVDLTPGNSLEIIGPDGRRAMPLEEARTARALDLPAEGFYELRRGGGRNELLAVNADRRESDLALAPKETLELWARQGGGGNAPLLQARTRIELWPWLIALALAVALAEAYVGRQYLEERKPAVLRKGVAA